MESAGAGASGAASSGAGSAAGSAGSGAAGAGYSAGASNGIGGAAGSTGNMYGGMVNMGGQVGQQAGSQGFSAAAQNTAQSAPSTGPTIARADNLKTYGTADPGAMDYAANWYERFQKGGDQNMAGAYRNRGDGAMMGGYLSSKLQSFAGAGAGRGGGQQPIVQNVSYQQPENEYLRRRRGY